MFLNVLISDADAVVHTKPELHSSPSTTGVARERSHTVKEGVCAVLALVPKVYLYVLFCVFFFYCGERSHTVKEGVCAYALLVPQFIYLCEFVCFFLLQG